ADGLRGVLLDFLRNRRVVARDVDGNFDALHRQVLVDALFDQPTLAPRRLHADPGFGALERAVAHQEAAEPARALTADRHPVPVAERAVLDEEVLARGAAGLDGLRRFDRDVIVAGVDRAARDVDVPAGRVDAVGVRRVLGRLDRDAVDGHVL